MTYIQLGFVRTRTETNAGGEYLIRHNLFGRYIVRIVGIDTMGSNYANFLSNDWIPRFWYIRSNEFFLANDVGNINDASAKYIRITQTDDNQGFFSPITTTMTFSGNPITMLPIGIVSPTGSQVFHCIFTCQVYNVDKIQLTKEPRIELPLFCSLVIASGTALASSSTTVYNIPVNANGRYRARLIGYTMIFGFGAVSSSTANGSNIIQVFSNALNNFGDHDGGSDGGLCLPMRNYRGDFHKRRNYPYFLTNELAGNIDIRPACKLTDLAVNTITNFEIYLELLPFYDRI